MNYSSYFMASGLFVLVFIIMITFNAGIYTVDHNESAPDVIDLTPDRPALSDVDFFDNAGIHTHFAVIICNEYAMSQTAMNTLFVMEILKQPYVVYDTIYDFSQESIDIADVILIATPDISPSDLIQIKEFLSNGGSVIFAVMPARNLLITEEFQNMAGIIRLQEEHTVKGFAVYSDILVEGTFRAREWEFDSVRVFLTGRCKVFATGHDPERDMDALVLDRNQENPLIWRTFYRGGAVYFINAPFMEYNGGIGVMMGILADNQEVLIYPVIGSKSILLESFPYISEEGRMIYNRTVFGFQRDIVWPDLISIALESGLVYTGLVNSDIAYNSNAYEVMQFFIDEKSRSIRGEIGYMMPDDTNIFNVDMSYLNSFPGLTSIRTFHRPDNGIHNISSNMTSLVVPTGIAETFEEITPQAITLPIISSGINSEQDSFNFMGVLDALGLAVHSIDMSVTFCESDYYMPWNFFAIEIARYFSYLFRRGQFLPFNTMAWTSEKVKNYMNTSFDIQRTETGIDVFMEGNKNEISFILRTRKSVAESQNCHVEEIAEGAFLVRSAGPEFSIRLK